ncbi:MAG: DsrE family protein [Planctomycetota bacterium]|nr:DsrE family protein [Planctomycetota bacterium]
MARILFVLPHSTEAPDRATIGLRTARAAQRAGHQVDLWLTGEGVRLGVQGVADTLVEPGPESAAELVAALGAGGATLHVERLAFEQRQFELDALESCARIADADGLAALLADGWQAVTL